MMGRNRGVQKCIFDGFLLIAAVLLSALSAGQVTGSTQLVTSVMGSAGAGGSSANLQMKSTLGQSTPIGPSSSANLEVDAGFWYQDPVAPSALGDLTATLSVSDIVLQWSHAVDNVAIDHYVVYRNTDPSFEPSSADSMADTKECVFLDPGAAGTVGTNYFYVVKAADPGGNLAEDSNRVGEFNGQMENETP